MDAKCLGFRINTGQVAKPKNYQDDNENARVTKNDLPYHASTATWSNRTRRTFGAIPAAAPGPVLDIGCARGLDTLDLAQSHSSHPFVAIDIDPEVLKIAAEKLDEPIRQGKLTLMQADGYKLTEYFPPGFFGAIYWNNNLYYVADHMGPGKLEAVLAQSLHCLNDEGQLSISAEGEYALTVVKGAGGALSVSYKNTYFHDYELLDPRDLSMRFSDLAKMSAIWGAFDSLAAGGLADQFRCECHADGFDFII